MTIKDDQLPVPDDEWANTATHAIGLVIAIAATGFAIWTAISAGPTQTIGCTIFGLSACIVFAASLLSHAVHQQPQRDFWRCVDQGTIYLMISGTYTPLTLQFAPPTIATLLLFAMWTAALTGFVSKLYFQHRLNNVSTVSYLALGWLPALVLGFYVPAAVGIGMLAGGIVYSIGVWFLIASDRFYFAHAIWHILVICAAGIHYGTILRYVAS